MSYLSIGFVVGFLVAVRYLYPLVVVGLARIYHYVDRTNVAKYEETAHLRLAFANHLWMQDILEDDIPFLWFKSITFSLFSVVIWPLVLLLGAVKLTLLGARAAKDISKLREVNK